MHQKTGSAQHVERNISYGYQTRVFKIEAMAHLDMVHAYQAGSAAIKRNISWVLSGHKKSRTFLTLGQVVTLRIYHPVVRLC